MKRRDLLAVGVSAWAVTLLAKKRRAAAQTITQEIARPSSARMVRLAELEIDPPQLAAYKAALAEEIDASLRNEPGVLMLEAVSLKEEPTQIRILEVYASVSAYAAHLESPHFRKYKATTQGMVKSLKLHEVEPIRIGAMK